MDLDTIAIALVLVSAAMHASWNAFGKHRVPTASFFLVANFGGMLLLVCFPFVFPAIASAFTAQDITWVILTGCFEAVYLSSLAAGYRSGDLSLVYPLARSIPALAVTVGSAAMGRADEISLLCWCGTVLIVAGCFFLPLDQFSKIRFRMYWNRTFLFAGLAAIGTTGYSLVDDLALTSLRSTHPEIHPVGVTFTYSFYQTLTIGFWLSLLIFSRKAGRASFREAVRGYRFALPTGMFITLTYVIILVALAFARDVSYVVAFRQSSIPIGVAIGVIFLKEGLSLPKLVGTFILVVGLILVSIA